MTPADWLMALPITWTPPEYHNEPTIMEPQGASRVECPGAGAGMVIDTPLLPLADSPDQFIRWKDCRGHREPEGFGVFRFMTN